MKRIFVLLLCGLCLTLAACNDSNDSVPVEPTYSGNDHIGTTFSTVFFDFEVKAAVLVDEYAGIVPQEGSKLLDVLVYTKNTTTADIEMYCNDYDLFWAECGEPAEVCYPESELMAPLAETILPGESMVYHYIYEVPEDVSFFALSYLEEMLLEDGSMDTGMRHYSEFTVQ